MAQRGRRKPGWSTQANEIVDRVFAYGTFRAGQPARAMIAAHVASSAPATARGRIYALPEGYPGMIDDATHTVVGELLELRDLAAALALLDAYEGQGYDRILRQVQREDGTSVHAWVYMMKQPEAVYRGTLIEDGDWVGWLEREG